MKFAPRPISIAVENIKAKPASLCLKPNRGIFLQGTPIKTLGRVFFIVLIPFIGSALAPWIVGPQAAGDSLLFNLWSFTVLIFIAGAFWGRSTTQKSWAYVHGLVSCCIAACGVFAVILAAKYQSGFAALAFLTVLHWAQLMWLRKSFALGADFDKQFSRFIWTLLACHMFSLFNLIYAVKTAQN